MIGTKEDWNKGEAMGGLIWIIVIVVVISEIKKLQGKSGQRETECAAAAAECASKPDGRTAECATETDTLAAERASGTDAAPAERATAP